MKFWVNLFLAILILPLTLAGQAQKHVLNSPQQSMQFYLENLQDNHFYPEQAAKVFRAKNLTEEELEDVAIKLKQVLDGEGHYIDLEHLPSQANYFDSTAKQHIYIIVKEYPKLYLQRINNEWVFGERAIREIEVIHPQVFRFGTDKLLNILPKIGTRVVFGLHVWQHVGILLLAFLIFLSHKVMTAIFERFIYRFFIQKGREKLAEKYVLPVARPISVFFVIFILIVFIPALQLPADISHYLIIILKASQPFFGTIVFYRLVNILALYLERLASQTESTLDDQLVPLIRKTLKTFVVAIGSLVVLDNLNVPILPLLTGLSIGGLAFALAAQDTIKNFFGSLMIFIDKPFQIGHWVTSGDIDGTVEEVGFRSTRIRTFRNSVMYVPNGKLADSMIDNHGLRQFRRFYTQIAIAYGTPPHLIEAFVAGLRTIVEQHPSTRKDVYHIYFNDLSAYSMNVMFYIFFDVPTWADELKARHEILLEIVKLANELGIRFAFPTQTLHMETFPGKPSLSPEYTSADEVQIRLNEYFSKN